MAKKPTKKNSKRMKTEEKYNLFASAYLSTKFNATQAAIAAGYSKKTAYSQGSRLLNNVEVQTLIKEKAKAALEKSETKIVRVIKELEEIAFCDITDFIEFENGDFKIKETSEMKEEGSTGVIASVQKVETEKSTRTSIKMHDKMKALELLGKYYALFTENLNIKAEEVKGIKVIIGKE